MEARNVVRHFERVAPGYGRLRARWPLGALQQQERLALQRLVHIEPGALVLDVGCGDGTTLAWVTACGGRGVGVDMSRSMALRCQRRGFVTCVQDMERLGFKPRFDWVLCIGVIEFAESPERSIRSLGDCVQPSGRLALLFPRRHWLGVLYAGYHRTHGVRIHLFRRNEVTALLSAAGFETSAWQDGSLSTLCVAQRRPPSVAPASA
ncbi:MAG: class I SAM-dependent methyltransferase [Deltaproteobacteria bacterium]|nr:class I SAM-dependent methyltransferase [Deltaproteobacteria bacterium]